jgi:hypothetical protein
MHQHSQHVGNLAAYIVVFLRDVGMHFCEGSDDRRCPDAGTCGLRS